MFGVIADVFLGFGAIGAAVYCYVLSGRLQRFNTLESGMGGAIAVLSAQVDEMTRSLERAQSAAIGSSDELAALVVRAESAAARLDLLVASMHDLPDVADDPAARRLRFSRRRREMEAAE